MDELFDKKILQASKILEVTTLESGYLKNEGGIFEFVPFDNELQVSPIMTFTIEDFDGDGNKEALIGGNFFGVKPYHGRFDSFPGALLQTNNEVILGNRLGLDFTKKSIRHLKTFVFKDKRYLLAVFNNDKALVYQINN